MTKDIDFFLVVVLVMVCGCCISRQTDMKLEGNNIRTMYGTGSVNSTYKANTTIGVFHGSH